MFGGYKKGFSLEIQEIRIGVRSQHMNYVSVEDKKRLLLLESKKTTLQELSRKGGHFLEGLVFLERPWTLGQPPDRFWISGQYRIRLS